MITTICGQGASPEGGTPPDAVRYPKARTHTRRPVELFAFDYIARQKVGGMRLKSFTVRQLAALTPTQLARPAPWSSGGTIGSWLERRVLALVLDTRDMTALARDFEANLAADDWDLALRRALRSEVDAAMFHPVRHRQGRRGLHYGDVSHRQAQGHRGARCIPHQAPGRGDLRRHAEAERTGVPYDSPFGVAELGTCR